MASTRLIRQRWHMYRCSRGVRRVNGFFGRHPVYEQEDTHSAVNALELGHLGSGYVPTYGGYIGSIRACPAGIGGRTCAPDGSGCSLHNYILAYDIEYQYNKLSPRYPSRVDPWSSREIGLHKYTRAQVAAIEGIKTVDGEQVWRWLGWIGDYMHWQINVATPGPIRIDVSTIPSALDGVDNGQEEQMLQVGDEGIAVRQYQQLLIRWNASALPGYKADGDFGNETREWVGKFQKAHDLSVTGNIDGVTADMLRVYTSLSGSQGPVGPQGPAGPAGPSGAVGPGGPRGAAGVAPEGTLKRGDSVRIE